MSCLQDTHVKSTEVKLLDHVMYLKGWYTIHQQEQDHMGVMLGIKHEVPWILQQQIIDPAGRENWTLKRWFY